MRSIRDSCCKFVDESNKKKLKIGHNSQELCLDENGMFFYSQYSHLAVKPFISRKSQFLPAPLAFDAPGKGGGVPSEYCHSVWCGRTKMVLLPDSGKKLKIYLFASTEYTNVTDGRTDGWLCRAYLCLASCGKNRDSRPYIWLHRVLSAVRPPSVIYTAAPDRGKMVTLVASSNTRRRLLFTGDDDEVFITRNLNVTRRQQNSI